MNEATTTLQLTLPKDIVTNNVLPFLELPPHTFEEHDGSLGKEDDTDDEELIDV